MGLPIVLPNYVSSISFRVVVFQDRTPLGRGRTPASLSPLDHRPGAFPPPDSLPTWTPATDAGVAARGPRLADNGGG
jgi:hypothetical protein